MFDFYKWIDDLIAIFVQGPGHKITWTPTSTQMGASIEKTLRRYGVKVYARQYAKKPGDDLGITVRRAQRKWAEYVLLKAGVCVTSPVLPSNRGIQPGGEMPQSWGVPAPPVGLAGRIMDIWMGGVK